MVDLGDSDIKNSPCRMTVRVLVISFGFQYRRFIRACLIVAIVSIIIVINNHKLAEIKSGARLSARIIHFIHLQGEQTMAIKDWPLTEQPRHKLLSLGSSVLSDAELLAIFLRTGVTGKNAVQLARELIQQFGSLRLLLQAEQTQFCAALGLGEAKYVMLQAVLEMARRHMAEGLRRESVFSNPQQVKDYLRAELRDQQHEVFSVLYLDNRHRLIRFEALFHGSIDQSAVYPREVLKKTLRYNAAAVIFAHNHPSGICEPSDADLCITKRLKNALALVDIRVLDHIIIGDSGVTSLAERGEL